MKFDSTLSALLLIVISSVEVFGDIDLTKEPGHMKRFGEGRPSYPIDEVDGFPMAKDFFQDYASVLKPLKMKGAAKLSPAFQLWTDDYFSSLEELDKEEVLIESRKKEDRTQPTTFMSLREFVKIYNDTDQYLVNSVPFALRGDMIVPCSVQCEDIVQNSLVEALMWFSSGGTKSVVHTDAVENINCLLRGDKELIMVDPLLYGDKVDLDHPEGSYSDIDVDAVDYTKYPHLAQVEFYHVNVTAGDCLYIPYRWIHQVRSYGSNLAVNIWWDHFKSAEINSSECVESCDYKLTLDKVHFAGLGTAIQSEFALRDHISTMMGIHPEINEDRFVKLFLGDDGPDEEISGYGYKDLVRKIFKVLDGNKDGKLTKFELEEMTSEVWQKARDIMLKLEVLLQEIEKDVMEAEKEQAREERMKDEL